MIFGVELSVEEKFLHGNRKTTCIVFQDAQHGNPLFDGGLNPGFFIPVWMLQQRLGTLKFRSAFEELFVTFLATRPEMKEAKRRRWEATQMELREKEKKAASVLSLLKQDAGNLRLPAKPFSALFLSEPFGYFKHESGVVLHIRKGKHNNFQISVAECPEGHELEGVKKSGAHAHRHHITQFAVERDEGLEGKFLQARVLRIWLRRELRAIGAIPTLEDASMVAVTPLQNEGSKEGQTPPAVSAKAPSGTNAKEAVVTNADLTEILGVVPGGTLPGDGLPTRTRATKKRSTIKKGGTRGRSRSGASADVSV
jgi:hypothetical protein